MIDLQVVPDFIQQFYGSTFQSFQIEMSLMLMYYNQEYLHVWEKPIHFCADLVFFFLQTVKSKTVCSLLSLTAQYQMILMFRFVNENIEVHKKRHCIALLPASAESCHVIKM